MVTGRPRKIKIGHLSFKVKWIKNAAWEEKDKSGRMYPMQQEIHVRLSDDDDNAYSEGNLREILIHEILHALYYVTNLSDSTPPRKVGVEEHTVLALAGPLLAVMRNNPVLMRYLTS